MSSLTTPFLQPVMEPEVSLIGYKILPGSPVVVGDKEDSENYIWTIHVTHFALAEKSKPGRNVVKISKDDESKFVLGTLEKDRCEQFTVCPLSNRPLYLLMF